MQSKYLLALALFFALSGAGLIGYMVYEDIKYEEEDSSAIVKDEQSTESGVCEKKEVQLRMGDMMLTGILEPGEKYTSIFGLQNCRKIQRDDLVTFQPNKGGQFITRIARALPGDKVEIIKDEESNAWNIKINGNFLPWKAGKKYYFGTSSEPILKTQEKKLGSELNEGEYILLSINAPGHLDSSLFGRISAEKIRGIVELD